MVLFRQVSSKHSSTGYFNGFLDVIILPKTGIYFPVLRWRFAGFSALGLCLEYFAQLSAIKNKSAQLDG